MFSRKEAAAAGMTRFRTGKPCKRGHSAERYVASGACCACSDEKARGAVRAYRAAIAAGRASGRTYCPTRISLVVNARDADLYKTVAATLEASRASGTGWTAETLARVVSAAPSSVPGLLAALDARSGDEERYWMGVWGRPYPPADE